MFKLSLHTLLFVIMIAAAPLKGDTEQNGEPFIGRTDPARFETVDYGGGIVKEMILLDGRIMGTNLLSIKRGVIPPKSGIGEHRHERVEEMYIALNTTAEFTVNGRMAHLPAGSSVACPPGSSHALFNSGDIPLEWITVAVSKEKGVDDGAIRYNAPPAHPMLESPAPFRWAQFDRTLLKPVGPAHKGKGLILNRRPWLDGSFETNWVRIGHCLLPPGTSIGYHRHDGIEEIYCILAGAGRSTVNNRTSDVRAGDVIPCTLHDSHGIYNNTAQDIDLFVIMVALEKGKLDNTDWGDDLSGK